MDDLDRRTIKPAHPLATIPDPDHRNDLPTDGAEVVWSHYWQAHLDKGNVVEVKAEPAPKLAAPAKAPASPPAPAA